MPPMVHKKNAEALKAQSQDLREHSPVGDWLARAAPLTLRLEVE
jgi:hypothetical protein